MSLAYKNEETHQLKNFHVPKIALIPIAAAAAELATHPMDFVKTQTQIKNA
jgi:hypothetical protein